MRWKWPIAVYRRLLCLYPPEFRRRFGRDLVEAFTDACHGAADCGPWALFAQLMHGVRDLVGSGIAEQRAEARRRPPGALDPSIRPERAMRFPPLGHDVRQAWRSLRAQPGLVLVVLLTLALGIGANTAIFSVVSAVLLRPLPYPDAERLTAVWETNPGQGWHKMRIAMENYRDWREQATAFQEMGAFGGAGFTITAPSTEPEQIGGARVTASYFTVLGVAPLAGRTIVADDARSGAPRVAVLSEPLWRGRFGADLTVLGQSITLDDSAYTIVGVMPDNLYPLSTPTVAGLPLTAGTRHVWVPLDPDMGCVRSRSCHVFAAIARLAPQTTLDAAQREMDEIGRRLAEAHPANQGEGVLVTSMHQEVTADIRPALVALLVAVGMVLLIACANLINLLLARAASRGRDLAVRRALGANRRDLVRQFVVESVILAAGGGILALLVALVGVDALLSLHQGHIPRESEIGVHRAVLAFNFGISLAVGVIMGTVPAFHMAGSDLQRALTTVPGRATTSRAGLRARAALAAGQMATAVILVVSASLLIKSLFGGCSRSIRASTEQGCSPPP